MSDATALIQAIAWPLVALVALFVLRKALPRFVAELGPRVTKISVLEVTPDFATLPEMRTTWQLPGFGDVRQPTSSLLFDTPAVELFAQFHDESAFDYVVVDLGEGREWLSSRLFVFAEMLPRLRGLRCFVFVERAGTIRRKLVGIARAEKVRWALASQFPWLEQALMHEYGEPYLSQISVNGAVPPEVAVQIGRAFVDAIQRPTPTSADAPIQQIGRALLDALQRPTTPAATADPTSADAPIQQIGRALLDALQRPTTPAATADPTSASPSSDGWVDVPGHALQEHGQWLDGGAIERLLGANLQQDAWVIDDPDASEETQVKAVLRRKGDLVAIVQSDMMFLRLIDRGPLVEELTDRVLRQ